MLEHTDIPSGARLTYIAIIGHIPYDNISGVAYPSIERLTDLTRFSKRAVITHIDYLEKHNFIQVLRSRYKSGKTKPNRYSLPPSVRGKLSALGKGELSALARVNETTSKGELSAPKYTKRNNKNEIDNNIKEVEENKEIVLKILESLKALGIKPTKRMSGFITKFADKHNDLPLDWIDKAQKEINDRDIEQPWPYMKKMLTNWHKQGSPQNGLNGKRISQVVPEVEYVPGLTPSRLL